VPSSESPASQPLPAHPADPTLWRLRGRTLAGERGIDGSTEPGTLDIYVDDDGDSRWQARVPVTDSAAERYRTNTTALEAAVDDAWTRYHAADGDVRSVETTLENETVVVNYAVDGVARRGVGDTWLVDYFAVGTSNARYGLAADRVTIHTPEGTTVTNRPARASVDGNAATWTRGGGFDRQTRVTYGSGGVLGTASGYATIGLDAGPTALSHGVSGGLVPGLLIGIVGIAITRIDWGVTDFDATTLERLIVVVGVLGAGGFLVVGAVSTGDGLAPGAVALASLGIGYALLGSAGAGRRATRDSRVRRSVGARDGRRRRGHPPARWAAGVRVSRAVRPGDRALSPDRARRRTRADGGCAYRSRRTHADRRHRGGRPVSVLGYGPAVYGLLLLPWVASVAVFGYPLALLGRRLAIDTD